MKEVKDMSAAEIISELKELAAKGVEIPAFSSRNKPETLAKLLVEARKVAPTEPEEPAVQPVVDEQVEPSETPDPKADVPVDDGKDEPVSTDATGDTLVPPVKAKGPKEVKSLDGLESVKVVCPNGKTRIYSQREHGNVWKDLAANFAEANAGKMY